MTSLAKVLARELAHTILTDTDPKSQETNGGHGQEHDQVSQEVLKVIEVSPEWKKLKSC